MSSNTTAVAVRDDATAVAAPRAMHLLRPIAAPAEVIEAQNEARALVHKALVQGRDYGVIPGTGDKPTMLKPGAERVALAFGCYYGTPEILEREVEHDREVRFVKTKWVTLPKPANADELKAQGLGRNKQFNGKWAWQQKLEERGSSLGLYRYVVRVPVINRATNEVVGSGVGSCSSMETKYIDRPRDCENTVLKMAHKRAMVAACLTTFGLSDEFTQDVEDMAQFSPDEQGASAPASAAPAEEAQVVENKTEQTTTVENEAEQMTTVEQALAMTLPGGPKAWNGKGGTPLGQLDAKMIPAIRKWIDTKITEAEAQDGEAPPVHYQLRKACDLILEMRKAEAEKDQGKMFDDTAAPAAGSGAPRENPTTLAPGKVEDALEKPAAREETFGGLAASAAALLKDPKLDENDRKVLRAKFDAATTAEQMRAVVAEIEKRLDLPF